MNEATRSAGAFNPCIVIPHFNHPRTIGAVVAGLRAFGVPCIVVDDASNAAGVAAVLEVARNEASWVTLVRHTVNQGKGAAVISGCEAALQRGFSHALQIDADGQHDLNDVPKLFGLARERPDAIVTGVPVYDASVPRSRFYGRYATHVWVWINTLSMQVVDSMCGLRVYPLATTAAIWRRTRIGPRMEFDAEIMVRAVWRGTPVVNVPTRVTYPADGVSHFDVWRDNVRISRMHAKLFFGMLWRSPMLIWRRIARRAAGAGA